MRIRIEHVESPEEEEIVIRCTQRTEAIARIEEFAQAELDAPPTLTFYKLDPDTRQSQEFFFPLEDVLFFETEKEQVYAHTATDAFRTKLRLYELEDQLPRQFIRASKSTIINTKKVFSIKRDLTSANCIQFGGTHKQVFASRRYYSAVKQRMKERHTTHET